MSSRSKQDLSVEFAKLADAHKNLSIERALEQTKNGKNRSRDVMPYDYNSVVLSYSADFPCTYINASYIDGFYNQAEYIATQGPLFQTVDDFWRMIWENNCCNIVMMTKLTESGELKCDKYWPDLGYASIEGGMTIKLSTEENCSEWVIRQIDIQKNLEERRIFHFQFIDWPDRGVPDKSKHFFDFTKEVRVHLDRFPFPKGPTVVHCSAGDGRTGTFIAMDCILQMFKANPSRVDIFNLVYRLRKQRMHLVQTKEQYAFLHQILKEMIIASKAAAEASQLWLEQTEYENINTF